MNAPVSCRDPAVVELAVTRSPTAIAASATPVWKVAAPDDSGNELLVVALASANPAPHPTGLEAGAGTKRTFGEFWSSETKLLIVTLVVPAITYWTVLCACKQGATKNRADAPNRNRFVMRASLRFPGLGWSFLLGRRANRLVVDSSPATAPLGPGTANSVRAYVYID